MAAPQPRFLLDANVFIEASNRYYQHTICPGFWKALIYHFQNRSVKSIDKVKEEILRKQDWLRNWVKKEAPEEYFRSTALDRVQSEYQRIIEWASNNNQYIPAAKSEFARGADGWLVAYAKVHRFVVVTQETPSRQSKKKQPIGENQIAGCMQSIRR